MAKHVEGQCHICGQHAKLSFEHVPPKSAFNDRSILRAHIFRIQNGSPAGFNDLGNPHVMKQRLGAGGYTLCESCNNDTGRWFGPAFAEWARQGMEIVQGTKGPTLVYPFNVYPLRVLKQAVCMFLSANPPTFAQANPDLVRLILNKNLRHLPHDVRIFAFYTVSDRSRLSGMTGLLRGLDTSSPRACMFSEVTFPPFGFAMTIESSSPDSRLCEITEFAGFDYGDRRQVWLRMPVMPIYTFYPGDYRSRDEVRAQVGRTLRSPGRASLTP